MSNRKPPRPKAKRAHELESKIARADGIELTSHRLGALPIVNELLRRMKLEETLSAYLPRRDARSKVSTVAVLMTMVRNIVLAREPTYGVGEWAAQFAPEALGLRKPECAALNDDRVGRALDQLFGADYESALLTMARHIIEEFAIDTSQLHNDSTSVRFCGKYADAAEPQHVFGKKTLEIRRGHSKDHRPDLKQLLFILTVARDGGVPIHFTPASGNITDDQTHKATWDMLRSLLGHPGFLYVADCKLATKDNLRYIDGQGGRFVTVLPRSRKEDDKFRRRLREDPPELKRLAVRPLEGHESPDIISLGETTLTAEGFPLHWIHSSRKEELDRAARIERVNDTLAELRDLRAKLASPRTRYRDRGRIEKKVGKILDGHRTRRLVPVQIYTIEEERFRQARPGRPTRETQYVRVVRERFDLVSDIDNEEIAAEALEDGYFPLVSNDHALSPLEVYHAYKKQPRVEKRFSQLKSHYNIAPVFLELPHRIEAIFCLYFIAMTVQALIEREARRGMERHGLTSLPIYPESRACEAPSTRRLLRLFRNVQRHVLDTNGTKTVFNTKLSEAQRTILRMLNIPPSRFE